jgi:hypothetical protein
MRRKFSAFLVLLSVTAHAVPASACSMPSDWTPEKAFAKAVLVFRGIVTSTELSSAKLNGIPTSEPATSFTTSGNADRFIVNARYELKEVFKGTPAPDGVVSTTTFILGGCGAPVLAGQEYLFYINPFDEETRQHAPEFVKQTQGMISIFDSRMLLGDLPKVDETLDELRALAKKH